MAVQLLTRLLGVDRVDLGDDAVDTSLRRVSRLTMSAMMTGVTVATVAPLAVLWMLGWRLFVTQTGSMGTAAPVGSLVITRPVSVGDLHVGDVISFHPPGVARVYTHRVVSITDSTMRTQGDVNAVPDPWLVTRPALIGRAVAVVTGLGWLLEAAGLLGLGFVAVLTLTRWVRRDRRLPARVLGMSVVITLVSAHFHLWVNLELAGLKSAQHSAVARVESTGLLPITVSPIGADAGPRAVQLDRAGALASMRLWSHSAGGPYQLAARLHLTPLQWVIALLVCLAPGFWFAIVGVRNDQRQDDAAGEG